MLFIRNIALKSDISVGKNVQLIRSNYGYVSRCIIYKYIYFLAQSTERLRTKGTPVSRITPSAQVLVSNAIRQRKKLRSLEILLSPVAEIGNIQDQQLTTLQCQNVRNCSKKQTAMVCQKVTKPSERAHKGQRWKNVSSKITSIELDYNTKYK